MDRPRTYVLEVNGTRGAQYFGVLTVDGATQRVNGAIPATFEFEAYRIDLAFALVRSKPDDNIAVKVLADGRDLKLGTKSQTGVSQQLRSYGYSETFGGTNASWHRMTIEEVDRLIKNQVMPRGMLLEP
jgi:hypothetical protein